MRKLYCNSNCCAYVWEETLAQPDLGHPAEPRVGPAEAVGSSPSNGRAQEKDRRREVKRGKKKKKKREKERGDD